MRLRATLPGLMMLGVAVVMAGAARAQVMPEYDAYGRYMGRTEQNGDMQRHFDAYGRYQGSSERSGSGTVLRRYDAEGRYLGREDIPRDPRQQAQPYPYPPPYRPPGVQLYVDPSQLLANPPPPMPEPQMRNNTPWFGDKERNRR
ncbi:hypothetical protein NON00_13460 [Roseomonas sp. GC11]|uniref:hypothetical protein n=1 Tax=Roseomonas sp. GC11 TaxID=2950546 RepID=UPI00210F04C4|nr:hypothetical protein [Roseomonas sp. GC11]MCQ4160936.1 hypothetical protein [Roseomonas sp. GC11]